MTTLPIWLAEKRDEAAAKISRDWAEDKVNGGIKTVAGLGADWMYATLKPEIDLLVEALEEITMKVAPNQKGHFPRNSADIALNTAFNALGRHKEKFGC